MTIQAKFSVSPNDAATLKTFMDAMRQAPSTGAPTVLSDFLHQKTVATVPGNAAAFVVTPAAGKTISLGDVNQLAQVTAGVSPSVESIVISEPLNPRSLLVKGGAVNEVPAAGPR